MDRKIQIENEIDHIFDIFCDEPNDQISRENLENILVSLGIIFNQ